ncbi:MAG: hypothetical protein ACYSSI_10320 [Planctomycetota bacterium]|jgi:hypothetical protein
MKNIIIACIIAFALIVSAYLLSSTNRTGRYKIIMNSGEMSGLLLVKYDTVTGRTWQSNFQVPHWIEVKDYGYTYNRPDKENK